MRGINFLAGLGTILIFAGVFSFKAAFDKTTFKEKMKQVNNVPVKNYQRPFLLFFGSFCIILGILLILKALQLV